LSKIPFFGQEIQKNLPKMGLFIVFLLENALILCNPRDKEGKFLLRTEQVTNYLLKIN